jgi:hypothetical protein
LRRITKAALGGLAGCAMIVGATQAANGEPPLELSSPSGSLLFIQSGSAFDNAQVTLQIKEAPDATNFKITVEDIDKSETNPVHGAHLHVGPCTEGTDTTLGHYKDGDPLAAATSQNEVWFDLETNIFGDATDSTTVPFVPVDQDGVMSIVIHAGPAAEKTSKLACFPLVVTEAPDWF